jgi:hypothetical protein
MYTTNNCSNRESMKQETRQKIYIKQSIEKEK